VHLIFEIYRGICLTWQNYLKLTVNFRETSGACPLPFPQILNYRSAPVDRPFGTGLLAIWCHPLRLIWYTCGPAARTHAPGKWDLETPKTRQCHFDVKLSYKFPPKGFWLRHETMSAELIKPKYTAVATEKQMPLKLMMKSEIVSPTKDIDWQVIYQPTRQLIRF
jgi:hypothetical protein